jgi:N-acetyl-anhydromuramyl-L-alanine amidase AmpD
MMLACCATFCIGGCISGCAAPSALREASPSSFDSADITQRQQPADEPSPQQETPADTTEESPESEVSSPDPFDISLVEDYRASFVHGDKGPANQKYIMLHDTEGDAGPASVIDWWDSNGNLVAAHFVIGKDGAIYQCVPLDKIAHHAGYGDAGHNASFGITEDGRDDMAGSVWIGDWAPDYGMNAWSIGIELVHVGGSGYYPPEQLEALDALIASIDTYYGFESTIIDHKAWRSGNSDTSPEFAEYLYNYQDHRRHTP